MSSLVSMMSTPEAPIWGTTSVSECEQYDDDTDMESEPEFENEIPVQTKFRLVFNSLESMDTKVLVHCFSSDESITRYADCNSDTEEVQHVLTEARKMLDEAFLGLSWVRTAMYHLDALVLWAEWTQLDNHARKQSVFDIEGFCAQQWFREGFNAFREVADLVQLNIYGVLLTSDSVEEEPSLRGRDILRAHRADYNHNHKYNGTGNLEDDDFEPEPSLELNGPQEAYEGTSFANTVGQKSQNMNDREMLATPTTSHGFLQTRIESTGSPSTPNNGNDNQNVTDAGNKYASWKGNDLKAECVKRHIVWRLLTNAQMAGLLAKDDVDPDTVPKNARTAKKSGNRDIGTHRASLKTSYNVDPGPLAQENHKYLQLRAGKLRPLLEHYRLRCTNLKMWQYIQSLLDHSDEARADMDTLLADILEVKPDRKRSIREATEVEELAISMYDEIDMEDVSDEQAEEGQYCAFEAGRTPANSSRNGLQADAHDSETESEADYYEGN